MKNTDTLGSFAAVQDHDQQTKLSGHHFELLLFQFLPRKVMSATKE